MIMQQNGKLWLQLVRLIVCGFAPLIVYFVIRPYATSDTEALALAWLIPVVWTCLFSLLQRRFDILGLLGVAAYGITLAISVIFGAGALPLKLHHALLGGAIGLICLISFAIKRPVFVFFAQRLTKNGPNASRIQIKLADPQTISVLTTLTLVVGIAFLTDAVFQTLLAIMLSTSAYLIAAPLVHIIVVAGTIFGALVVLWIRSRRYSADGAK